jgi:hypothetical protein
VRGEQIALASTISEHSRETSAPSDACVLRRVPREHDEQNEADATASVGQPAGTPISVRIDPASRREGIADDRYEAAIRVAIAVPSRLSWLLISTRSLGSSVPVVAAVNIRGWGDLSDAAGMWAFAGVFLIAPGSARMAPQGRFGAFGA